MDDAFCPHCRNLLQRAAPYPFPSGPTRCGSCLLMVSAGRSITAAGARRVPRGIDVARRMSAGTSRPGPVGVGPDVDLVQAVLREVDGFRATI